MTRMLPVPGIAWHRLAGRQGAQEACSALLVGSFPFPDLPKCCPSAPSTYILELKCPKGVFLSFQNVREGRDSLKRPFL